MYTEGLAARWAGEALLLPLQEALHAMLPDIGQILHHAHVIFGAVTLVQRFQALAGLVTGHAGIPAVVNSLFAHDNLAVRAGFRFAIRWSVAAEAGALGADESVA